MKGLDARYEHSGVPGGGGLARPVQEVTRPSLQRTTNGRECTYTVSKNIHVQSRSVIDPTISLQNLYKVV